jgi:hypothetical protein
VTKKHPANAIVVSAAREILENTGFQPDRSGRTWYEDNGWYVSAIDFQPIVGRPGSFLNVWAHFLWTPTWWRANPDDYIETFGYGGRIGDNRNLDGTTIEYDGNDDLFSQQAKALAQRSYAEAEKLHALQDWGQAKSLLLTHRFEYDQLWGNWHRSMLCVVTGHPSARGYLTAFSQNEVGHNQYLARFVPAESASFLSLLNDISMAQARISDTISHNRELFQAKVLPILDLNYHLECPKPDPTDQDIIPSQIPKSHRWKNLFRSSSV